MNQRRVWIVFCLMVGFLCSACDSGADESQPSVIITFPVEGAEVTEPITVKAQVSDNEEVQNVQLLVDGDAFGSDQTEPFDFAWDAGPWADGKQHTLLVRAVDLAGNVGTDQISVVVVEELSLMFISDEGVGSTPALKLRLFGIAFQGPVFLLDAVVRGPDSTWVVWQVGNVNLAGPTSVFVTTIGDQFQRGSRVLLPGSYDFANCEDIGGSRCFFGVSKGYANNSKIWKVTARGRTLTGFKKKFELSVECDFARCE